MNENSFKRKNNRLRNYDYSSCGMYFITICALEKRNYFWQSTSNITNTLQDVELSEYGLLLETSINKIPEIYPCVEVDQYAIMPDHVHMILMINNDDNNARVSVSNIINQMKGYFAKKIGVSIWQKSFYDHIIRNQKDYEAHLKYIYENPIGFTYKKKDMRF